MDIFRLLFFFGDTIKFLVWSVSLKNYIVRVFNFIIGKYNIHTKKHTYYVLKFKNKAKFLLPGMAE